MIHKAIIALPTYTKRGKVLLLSYNIMRNMHYFSLNTAKQNYQNDVLGDWVKTLPKFKRLHVCYKIFFNNKRKKDLDNYTIPLQKFLMDALVKGGVIEDDNYEYLLGFSSCFGGFADENYAVVELIELAPREDCHADH